MKNLFTLLFVFFLHSAWATNYYFSTVSGDDSRTAAQAQNPSTPWKTIGRLNSYFSSLQPGDAVLLKRGETFYGSITVNKSGTASSPIVIGAYGTGDKPVITGLTTLTNWVSVGHGIYESYNTSLGSNLGILLLNDEQQPMGRYPNTGYLTLESHSGKTSITDNQLSSSPNWTSAELVTRPAHWLLNRSKITSHSGNTLYYSGISEPNNNFGYFIQNSIKTLDQLGEWYYDKAAKKVSVYFGEKSPSSFRVTASALDYAISALNKSYVVFDNLTLKGVNNSAISFNKGRNLTVKNCDVQFSGIDGVKVSNHAYFTIENCAVSNSYNNGISVGTSNTYAIIRNNIIRNSYAVPGMGQSGEGQGAGIRVNKSSIAEYNQVINSGFIGIQMGGDSCIVKNNYIDNFCFVKDDGGGIYTYNNSDVTNYGRKVTGNIILNGIGAAAGTNTTNSSAEGIYMDGLVNGVEIAGNTIANSNKGLFLNNARDVIVKNNTLFNNGHGQLHMQHNISGGFRNNTITNNIFFSKTITQPVSVIASKFDNSDINNIGRLDSNYYARPIDDRNVLLNTIYLNSAQEHQVKRDLEGWKLQYNLDPQSKTSAKQITSFKINGIVGSNKYAFGSFNSSKDVKLWGNNCTTSWANSGVLDGGYVKVVPSAKSSSIVIGIGALSSDKKYILKYSIKGSSRMSISAYLRSSQYKPITSAESQPVTTTRSENEMLFTPSQNEASGSVVLFVDAQSTYYLDNIQLYEAEATATNPDDSIRFVFNPSQVIKTVSLDGNYVDVKNNKYSNSIQLQPYQSAVLIKDGQEQKTLQNAAPAVSITSPTINTGYKALSTINISANASDADGKITKVEFYDGSALLHTEFYIPYTYSWNNVPAGTHTLTAKATDNNGNVTISKTVTVSVVAGNVAPNVTITSPKVNATYYKAAATVNISANASDADGKITKVQFYNGTTLLHTELNAPYSWDWKNVRAGNYTITAVAIDDKGTATKSASATILVEAQTASRSLADTTQLTNNEHSLNLRSALAGKVENAVYNVKVFPNPAINKIQINVDGLQLNNQQAQLSITNLSGILIKKMPVALSGKTIEADVTSLSAGMYIVSIVSDNIMISKKFVKN
ncbi:Ig-like domain-containing protein [Segetibacter koreensis]|uniref:Ig-like domain-containing protein n=1 Tax=Segetibacter koreensis TaxID=398037 RepID=UPI00037A79EB|nr:Ig-like domain-containing protein [Segetibacter koreensis]